ncbi:MAG: cytochrome c oxidase subunit I [Candidatus Eisenbacteria bacterium]|uniref:Cytochrome c oxidase subunit I n=1 Tax=Eiseniibacteriota bacterium TaxID=2212470 RepID=A0A7Y2H3H5_UNCEI|nr:cytochrome c oxidase subunit I [Candidatus Eisenbacteria bacterium]
MATQVEDINPDIPSDVNYLNVTKGLKSWLTTHDHKRIGVMYLYSVMAAFLVGGMLALAIRLELLSPGQTVMSSETYNQVFTLHGIIMIFLFIIPSIPAALGNFIMPLVIGAKDVAFPKLNLASYYIWVVGAIFTIVAIITGGVDTGWTFYTPQSIRQSGSVIWMGLGIFILGFSSIFTGLNFLVTMHKLRDPKIGWFDMPLFCWAIYGTALIQILATPVLAITVLLLAAEKIFQVGIFNPALGGDPVLFQHFFWFYSHPAVYIMILPGMGVISETITAFSHKPIFGYRFVAFSSIAIAVLGFLVWGHHMFLSAESEFSTMIFSFLTFFVAIPSAIKIFNWTATLYKGSIALTTGMLYTLAFLFLFSIGGLTGIFLGALSVDVHLHDTYFVVAHFHYVMMGGTVMAFLAGIYYWWPKITGRMYPENISRFACLLVFIGFNVTFLTQFVVGSKGMPRRYYDYLEQFAPLNQFSTFGSWILGAGILIATVSLLWSLKNGQKATANPWGAAGLEWKTGSPPPLENFHELPEIKHGPYDYDYLYGGQKPTRH